MQRNVTFGGNLLSTKLNMINAFFYQKNDIFNILLTTRIKEKEKHNNDVYDTKYKQPKRHSSSTIKSKAFSSFPTSESSSSVAR